MRTNRSLWISMSVFLCTLGGYLVFDSVHDSGGLAEGGILFGGILIGCALFPVSLAIEEHLQLRALQRHMGRVHEPPPGRTANH
jgi:ABC-type protease/lipase transport system fused ATPase/permease subunit